MSEIGKNRAGRAAAAALVAVLILPALAQAENQDVIDYRQDIMKTLGEESAIISQILEHKAPPEHFTTHMQVLAITAATAKQAFTPNVPGGEAKPQVWAKWPDFSKRLDELTAALTDLAKTAKQGGVAAAGSKLEAAFTCKGCHDDYREEKKK